MNLLKTSAKPSNSSGKVEQFMDYVYPQGPIQVDPTQIALDQLKRKVMDMTSYTPQAQQAINTSHLEPTDNPKVFGQYHADNNTTYLNSKFLDPNNPGLQRLMVDTLRHEYGHLLDDQSSNNDVTNSKDFFPKFENTANPLQDRGLQNFYQREFGQNARINQAQADIEGFAQTGAEGQDVLNTAPEAVKEMYQKIYTPIIKNYIAQIMNKKYKVGGID